jgi:hypothetical protein
MTEAFALMEVRARSRLPYRIADDESETTDPKFLCEETMLGSDIVPNGQPWESACDQRALAVLLGDEESPLPS